jgi:hypothetical protein
VQRKPHEQLLSYPLDDRFEVILEGAVETPEQGVAVLHAFAQTKYP